VENPSQPATVEVVLLVLIVVLVALSVFHW
jgi:hypothetical protein